MKKDGYFQRATLCQGGKDWANMFAMGNKLMVKATLGCADGGDAIVVKGMPVQVTVDAKHRVVVATADKSVNVGTLIPATENSYTSEKLSAIFWHPDVSALVIEVHVTAEHGTDMRYIWVDLTRVGVPKP